MPERYDVPLSLPWRSSWSDRGSEEELEQLAVRELGRIEHDLDRFRVRAVIAVGRVRHVAAAVTHACGATPGSLRIKSCMPQKHPPARIAVSVFAIRVISIANPPLVRTTTLPPLASDARTSAV